MSKIYVSLREGLKENKIRKAIIKSVSYVETKGSTIGNEEIHMETEDGLTTPSDGWFINRYCFVHSEEFLEAREKILSGEITDGTEVTVVYNPNGIMYFYL